MFNFFKTKKVSISAKSDPKYIILNHIDSIHDSFFSTRNYYINNKYYVERIILLYEKNIINNNTSYKYDEILKLFSLEIIDKPIIIVDNFYNILIVPISFEKTGIETLHIKEKIVKNEVMRMTCSFVDDISLILQGFEYRILDKYFKHEISSEDNLPLIEQKINDRNNILKLTYLKKIINYKIIDQKDNIYIIKNIDFLNEPHFNIESVHPDKNSKMLISLSNLISEFNLIDESYDKIIHNLSFNNKFEVISTKYFKPEFTKNKVYTIESVNNINTSFITLINDLDQKCELTFGQLFQNFKIL